MHIYKEWGFSGNPFNTTSLTADKTGNELIAGRDQDIGRFLRRLYNQPQIVTVEGDNGMGKTSLINVAVYRALDDHIKNKENALFFPCNRIFQISSETNYENFLCEVMIEIAQTIIKYKEDLIKLKVKLPDNIDSIDDWLNSPQNKSYQGSIGLIVAQIGGGISSETNTSQGFLKSGFINVVLNWLKQIFPSKNSGGIVCVIDNLELLEKSTTARKTIENLRDTLLTVHGIRWVCCGSLGIVSSILSSPRLEGFLHDPISIGGINTKYVKDILQKRIELFKLKDSYYLPITNDSFEVLYATLKSNIRNTIKYANEYCIWTVDNDLKPTMKDEKENSFLDWLIGKSMKYKCEIEKHLKPNSLKLFTSALELGDNFAFGDFELFGFDTIHSFRTCVNELEGVGLVINVIDENDQRRRSIHLTEKGWFVSYAMKNNK
jgi:hypothetical protein